NNTPRPNFDRRGDLETWVVHALPAPHAALSALRGGAALLQPGVPRGAASTAAARSIPSVPGNASGSPTACGTSAALPRPQAAARTQQIGTDSDSTPGDTRAGTGEIGARAPGRGRPRRTGAGGPCRCFDRGTARCV